MTFSGADKKVAARVGTVVRRSGEPSGRVASPGLPAGRADLRLRTGIEARRFVIGRPLRAPVPQADHHVVKETHRLDTQLPAAICSRLRTSPLPGLMR